MKTILDPDIINQIKQLTQTKKIYLSKESHIIFVCGASLETNNGKNARKNFIDYANKHLREYDIFIAEKFFDLFKGDIDLLTIEDKLGQYSDCIIIFLESYSAIAELGAFANNSDLFKQILVINENRHKESDSFITKGPIRRVKQKSIFGDQIFCDMDRALEVVSEIKNRLLRIDRKYNKGLNIRTNEDFKNMGDKKRMFFILDLITILQPVAENELKSVIESLFDVSDPNINFDLSLLFALGYIEKVEEYYIKKKEYTKMFYIFSRDQKLIKLRSLVLYAYRKNDRDRIMLLAK
jgi:hypothetical protein